MTKKRIWTIEQQWRGDWRTICAGDISMVKGFIEGIRWMTWNALEGKFQFTMRAINPDGEVIKLSDL